MTKPAMLLLLVVVTTLEWFSPPLSVEAKRVLMIPVPLVSLTKYQLNVAHALVRKGHEVWMTMPDHIASKRVLDTTNVTVIQYKNEVNLEEGLSTLVIDRYMKRLPPDRPSYLGLVKKYIYGQLSNDSLLAEFKQVRPDFVILDCVPFYKMMAIIPHRLRLPFGFVGFSFTDSISMRVPASTSVTPYIFAGPYTQHMTFMQRMHNTMHYFQSAFLDPTMDGNVVERYAPNMPNIPIDMLVARAEIWLIDTDHILDYPRPSLPNVKLVGGLAAGPGKPLEEEFKTFMDNASEGVAIVSFGSFILDLPPHLSDKIFSVLQQLPMKSIFRSSLTLPNSKKIMTSSWLPQNDLLAHPMPRYSLVTVATTVSTKHYTMLSPSFASLSSWTSITTPNARA
ncbi:hypothetical protein C0Q70_01548 [Pomacea canaliculata]|uniref:UDP-glucuronosyltransferase n=1 Tax=Pomacea canaliculata TaxID=400727 RepID=A0A2T7PZS1_POMCA|nr:hypothetical protein C0Q70_01548 [Pomacea canaliculata]